jgi:hypothetical protein
VQIAPEQAAKMDAFGAEFIWPEIAASGPEFDDWLPKLDAVQWDFPQIMTDYDEMVRERAQRAETKGVKGECCVVWGVKSVGRQN